MEQMAITAAGTTIKEMSGAHQGYF